MEMMRKYLVFAGLACLSLMARAQVVPPLPELDQSTRPGEQRLQLPSLEAEETGPKFTLPPVTIPDDYAALSSRLQIFVKGYAFSGNQIIPDGELEDIARDYTNRTITSLELQQLRRELTLYYINKGYINSGVLLPDQKVVDGIVRFEVIEGSLTDVNISGNKQLRSKYIQDRLVIRDDVILNINTLRDQLKLLQQSPLIDQLHARLGPGMRRGEAILDLEVQEAKPYSLSLKANNYRSPSVGAETAVLDFSNINLTGHEDTFRALYEKSNGLEEYFTSYAIPFGVPETTFEVSYEKSDSLVVEEPFDLIDIESDSKTLGLKVSHRFRHTLTQQLTAGIGFDRRSSKAYLLGSPFSFSPGVENGEADVSALRLSLDWVKRKTDMVLAARSVLSIGVDAFGSTTNNIADSKFVSLLGQFQMAKRLGYGNSQLLFKANFQFANDALLPMEKFSMGGRYTVRGYRENQFVRDNGVNATVEIKIPFYKEGDSSRLHFVPFYDYGRSWNDEAAGSAEEISSLGAGLVWGPVKGFYGEFYVAHALNEVEIGNRDENLQDSGVHFQIGYQIF